MTKSSPIGDNTSSMTHILITYSVKEEWSEYNKELIEEFIQQLRDYSISRISHVVYRLETTSFIHICRYTTVPLCDKATNIPAFKHFLSTLESIIDKEPITNAIEEIDHYPD
jgi:hypothetical protein